jgi:hypothetical protein
VSQSTPVVIANQRGGRNGADPPLSLNENQCVEALNVDWYFGTFAHKRAGSSAIAMSFSAGGPFTGIINSIWRHVPGVDESAAELWAVDAAATPVVGRMAGANTFAAPTLVDNWSSSLGIQGLAFAGMNFQAGDTAQNRLHVWDPSISKVRRVGLATPDPPTVATQGGAGLTFTRFYRIRTYDGTTPGKRRSEASTSVSITITDDTGVTVTRPTLPTNENETDWEAEYADAAAGPWYRAGRIATGTTTYSDTAATISTTNPSDLAGTYWPPPSAKYLSKANARILMAGAWETSGGYTVPSPRTVWWTPPFGASDIGDAERIPNFTTGKIGPGYGINVDADITGLSPALDGTVYVFGYHAIWALIPTQSVGALAFQVIPVRSDIGCIRHETIQLAEDENGQQCVYFLSHKGPYRIGAGGVQYLGNDNEDIWFAMNLDASTVVGHTCAYPDKHQVWWWVATGTSNTPDVRMMFDTRLGRSEGDSVYQGWAKHTGLAAAHANCSCLFSVTRGASMTRALRPYFGEWDAANRIIEGDTGTHDNGSGIQAYIDTKPLAPFGLGSNCSVTDPQLVAEVATGVTITISPLSDFGLSTAQAGSVSLTPIGSETRVQRRVEGLQAAGAGVIGFRVGDAVANQSQWTLDAVIANFQQQEARS